jgi:hypothetical protein
MSGLLLRVIYNWHRLGPQGSGFTARKVAQMRAGRKKPPAGLIEA